MKNSNIIIAVHRILDSIWTIALQPISLTEATILAHTNKLNPYLDDANDLPTFKIIEDSDRVAIDVKCNFAKSSGLVSITYKVTNPQFIFSYSENLPIIRESAPQASENKLNELCEIEASGTFLTEHLSPALLQGDEAELLSFISERQWEPVEDYEPRYVLEMISSLGCSMENFVKTEILDKQPNFVVIWHYIGEKPTISTYRASCKDDALAMFCLEMIDHSSNYVKEFEVDSVEPLKL